MNLIQRYAHDVMGTVDPGFLAKIERATGVTTAQLDAGLVSFRDQAGATIADLLRENGLDPNDASVAQGALAALLFADAVALKYEKASLKTLPSYISLLDAFCVLVEQHTRRAGQ